MKTVPGSMFKQFGCGLIAVVRAPGNVAGTHKVHFVGPDRDGWREGPRTTLRSGVVFGSLPSTQAVASSSAT